MSTVTRERKAVELKLAVHIATHSAIKSIDHLVDILKVSGKGSSLENLRLHRTKCSKLIINVISPAILQQLVMDVGDSKYSLIVDESTDVSVSKYMAFCIRYFSKPMQSITNEFLGLVTVERATADALRDITLQFLKELKLKPENIIGLGVDGASNLCGRHHSLYTLLKEVSPNLQLIKCLCHSLNTCSSKASEVLPANLEFMLRETVSWFSYSPLRKLEYARLYETINGEGKKLKQLVKLCPTRWLAFYNCIKVILDQWLELKTCFEMAGVSEKCHSARTLNAMFKDDTNLLYFTFLKPILKEVTQMNLKFQSLNADITKVYGELKQLMMSIAKRIIKPSFLRDDEFPNVLSLLDIDRVSNALNNSLSLLPLDAIDFGFAFSELTEKKTVTSHALQVVKERCGRFLFTLCQELVKRLPQNTQVIQKLRCFSPVYVLSQIPPKFKDLPLQLLSKITFSKK